MSLFFEFVVAAGVTLLALSAAAIAWQLTRVTSHLEALAGGTRALFPILIEYLTQRCAPDCSSHHHFAATDPPDMIVWEWRDGRWVLRSESAAAVPTAAPPARAGAFAGECVVTQHEEAFA